ncbi:hypothetical protein CTZ27_03230 [Streptomyces griseocarneus]|nr:hypothetical protein CTZ27_03230 [Streptomyces griseocarneus]
MEGHGLTDAALILGSDAELYPHLQGRSVPLRAVAYSVCCPATERYSLVTLDGRWIIPGKEGYKSRGALIKYVRQNISDVRPEGLVILEPVRHNGPFKATQFGRRKGTCRQAVGDGTRGLYGYDCRCGATVDMSHVTRIGWVIVRDGRGSHTVSYAFDRSHEREFGTVPSEVPETVNVVVAGAPKPEETDREGESEPAPAAPSDYAMSAIRRDANTSLLPQTVWRGAERIWVWKAMPSEGEAPEGATGEPIMSVLPSSYLESTIAALEHEREHDASVQEPEPAPVIEEEQKQGSAPEEADQEHVGAPAQAPEDDSAPVALRWHEKATPKRWEVVASWRGYRFLVGMVKGEWFITREDKTPGDLAESPRKWRKADQVRREDKEPIRSRAEAEALMIARVEGRREVERAARRVIEDAASAPKPEWKSTGLKLKPRRAPGKTRTPEQIVAEWGDAVTFEVVEESEVPAPVASESQNQEKGEETAPEETEDRPDLFALPPFVRAVRLDLYGHRWGVECDRHGGMAYLVPGEYRDREDAQGHALLHAYDHPVVREPLMSDEIEAAVGLAFSKAQLEILSYANQGWLTEDASGFYTPEQRDSWKPKPFALNRVLVLWAAGFLDARGHGEHRRLLTLSDKGEAAWELWDRARRLELVEPADKDNDFGVTAKQRRAYPLLKNAKAVDESKPEAADDRPEDQEADDDPCGSGLARVVGRTGPDLAACDVCGDVVLSGRYLTGPDRVACVWCLHDQYGMSEDQFARAAEALDTERGYCVLSPRVLKEAADKQAADESKPETAEDRPEDQEPDEQKPAAPETTDDDRTPVLVFIVSKNTTPPRLRGLWRVTRAEAMKVCSDDRTSGRSHMLCWMADPGQEGEDWEWIKDSGSYDALLSELGIMPERTWPEQSEVTAEDRPDGEQKPEALPYHKPGCDGRTKWLYVAAEGVARMLRHYLSCDCGGTKLGNFHRSAPAMATGTQRKPLGIREANTDSADALADRNSYDRVGPFVVLDEVSKRAPVQWRHDRPVPVVVDPNSAAQRRTLHAGVVAAADAEAARPIVEETAAEDTVAAALAHTTRVATEEYRCLDRVSVNWGAWCSCGWSDHRAGENARAAVESAAVAHREKRTAEEQPVVDLLRGHPPLIGPLPMSLQWDVTELVPGLERVIFLGQEFRLLADGEGGYQPFVAGGRRLCGYLRWMSREDVLWTIEASALFYVPHSAKRIVRLHDKTRVHCVECEPGFAWGRGKTPKAVVEITGAGEVFVCVGHLRMSGLVPKEYTDGLSVDDERAALAQYAAWVGGQGERPMTAAERAAGPQRQEKQVPKAAVVARSGDKTVKAPKVGDIVFKGRKDDELAVILGHLYEVEELAGEYLVQHARSGDTVCHYVKGRPAMKRAILADAIKRGEQRDQETERAAPEEREPAPLQPAGGGTENSAADTDHQGQENEDDREHQEEPRDDAEPLPVCDGEGRPYVGFRPAVLDGYTAARYGGWEWSGWWCDTHCETCAGGAECADCPECTAFAAPYPPHWARDERPGEPYRGVEAFGGPGGMSQARRIVDRGGDWVLIEWNRDAAATARAAGHWVVEADIRTLDPRHPVLRRVRRYHGSPPCQTLTTAGLRSAWNDQEIAELQSVMWQAGEAFGFLEVDDLCSVYGGPHSYFGDLLQDDDGWSGVCEGGFLPPCMTPDEFREWAREVVSDERTALMAEMLIWPMCMVQIGAPLESVTLEQSANLIKQTPALAEALQTEFLSVEGFNWAWCSWQIADAADTGAATHRERAWMVATREQRPRYAVNLNAAEEAEEMWAHIVKRTGSLPESAPELSGGIDPYQGRPALPTVTVAAALGLPADWWADTRGKRKANPETGKALGGGSFPLNAVGQCVTAPWYGVKFRPADVPQGEGTREITREEQAVLVGFPRSHPWTYIPSRAGVHGKRPIAQMIADAVSPFMSWVSSAVNPDAADWYEPTAAYQADVYRLNEDQQQEPQPVPVPEEKPKPDEHQEQEGPQGYRSRLSRSERQAAVAQFGEHKQVVRPAGYGARLNGKPEPTPPAVREGESIQPKNPGWGHSWWLFTDVHGYRYNVEQRSGRWRGHAHVNEELTPELKIPVHDLAQVGEGRFETADELLQQCRAFGEERAVQDAGARMLKRLHEQIQSPNVVPFVSPRSTPEPTQERTLVVVEEPAPVWCAAHLQATEDRPAMEVEATEELTLVGRVWPMCSEHAQRFFGYMADLMGDPLAESTPAAEVDEDQEQHEPAPLQPAEGAEISAADESQGDEDTAAGAPAEIVTPAGERVSVRYLGFRHVCRVAHCTCDGRCTCPLQPFMSCEGEGQPYPWMDCPECMARRLGVQPAVIRAALPDDYTEAAPAVPERRSVMLAGEIPGYTWEEARDALRAAGVDVVGKADESTVLLILGERGENNLRKVRAARERDIPCMNAAVPGRFDEAVRSGLWVGGDPLPEPAKQDRTGPSSSEQSKEIRAWAKRQGYKVKKRMPLSEHIRVAYELAHQTEEIAA